MLSLGCIALLAASPASAPQTELLPAPTLALESVLPSGEPLAAAFSPDGQRVFALEGTWLVELDCHANGWLVLDAVELDTEALGLHVDEKRIYVAGGSAGCVVVDYGAGLSTPVRIAEEVGKACVDVATDGASVAILFSDYARSTVRILLQDDLSPMQRIRLTAGGASAIEIHGSEVYLAEGSLGVRHIPLRTKPPGSASARVTMPAGGFARDLALSENNLWIAAGKSGLVRIDLEQAWGTPEALRSFGLGSADPSSYALRIAADGSHLALGTGAQSANEADALPAGLLGAPGSPLGWDHAEPRASGTLELWSVDSGGTPAIASRPALAPGDWRSLEIAGDRVLVQRSHDGLRIAELGGHPVRFGERRLGRGISALDGHVLPNAALLFGHDGRGSVQASGLRLRARNTDLWSATENSNNPGWGSTTHWRSAENGSTSGPNWIAHGGAAGLQVAPEYALDLSRVELPSAMTPEVEEAPVLVHAFGAFVAVSRPATHHGLAIYRQSVLEAFASDRLPNAPSPLAVLRTSADLGAKPQGVWRCDSIDMGRGRWLLVCAAGAGTSPENPELPRPRMLSFLVDEDGAQPLATTLGSDGPGLATAVAVFQERGRRWALLASLGGQLELFDLSNPAAPHSVVHQPMAPSPWDAHPPALLDVEVIQHPGSASQALVAAGRAGLLRFDLGDLQGTPPHPDLIPDEAIDTPGWAAGVVLATSPHGGRRVLVGDQRGGARVYRWIYSGPTDATDRLAR